MTRCGTHTPFACGNTVTTGFATEHTPVNERLMRLACLATADLVERIEIFDATARTVRDPSVGSRPRHDGGG